MDKVLSMVGLAKRAGKTCTGTLSCMDAVRNGSASLVIIAEDASANTLKALTNACSHYKVKYMIYSDMNSIGHFTGGSEYAAVSINDESFAAGILSKIDANA